MQDPKAARQSVMDHLGYLKACCQGIEPAIDLEDEGTSSTGNKKREATQEQKNVANVMWEVTQDICRYWGGDEEVMQVRNIPPSRTHDRHLRECTNKTLTQALFAFIEKTFRTDLPIFTPTLACLIDLLLELYSTHPFACILDAAAMTTIAYGAKGFNEVDPDVAAELKRLLEGLTRVSVGVLEGRGVEDRPEVVHSFFGMVRQVRFGFSKWGGGE